MPRERDVRNAIAELLNATNQFSDVMIAAINDITFTSSAELAAAVIDPVGGGIASSAHHGGGIAPSGRAGTGVGWDDRAESLLDYTGTVRILIVVMAETATLRDEKLDRLLAIICNQVNGKVLVPGFTIPAKTIVSRWAYVQETKDLARHLEVTVSYGFLTPWNAWDESE